MRKGKLLFFTMSLCCATAMWAQNAALMSYLQQDPTRVGMIMHGFEFSNEPLTPAPKDYVPFYISHYGRHGSRSAWGEPHYRYLVSVLQKEDSAGNLSGRGQALLQIAQIVLEKHASMNGRLTDKGEREHAMMAARMYERFPEVFAGDSPQVHAVSSKVERCIVSMAAFTNSLTRCNTKVQYNFDVGDRYQAYIDCAGKVDEKRHWEIIDSLKQLLPSDTVVVYQRLFVNAGQAHRNIGAEKLINAIFETAAVATDFDVPCNILDYLPMMEAYRRMVMLTYQFCVRFGNIPGLMEMRRQSVQLGLNDFIDKADEAIRGGVYCADLRFGHDIPLLAMMSAMEVSGVGQRLQPGEIESKWYGAENLCMASNLQLVFYRPKKVKGELTDETILVKVLYNEKERTVAGVESVQGGYYKWSDLKKKWMGSGEVMDLNNWKPSF